MTSWIRLLADYALLVMTLITGALLLFLAAPRARPCPVRHPVACHGCSANAPPSVLADRDAYLVRIGAIEIEPQE
jgi:hypothetical protein